MRAKIDENLHLDMATAFRARGRDTLTVHDRGMRSSADTVIASGCLVEGRGIVTLDLDFADARQYPPQSYAGLIVFRLRNESRGHVLRVPDRLPGLLESESAAGQLWIVEEDRIRIRGQLLEGTS